MRITEALLEAQAELERHRGRTDIRLDELVQIANHLINLVVPRQPSDRVAETLNERTLRFYITEGLIDRPVGKEGTAALYGYRHLLQALIVKALQGSYLPIKRIKEILAAKTDVELEEILACQAMDTPGDKNKSIRVEEALPAGPKIDIQTAPQKAWNFLNSLKGSPQPPVPGQEINNSSQPSKELKSTICNFRHRAALLASDNKAFPASDSWERYVLADGIELHVRADRVKGLRSSEIKRILERLLNLLKTRK